MIIWYSPVVKQGRVPITIELDYTDNTIEGKQIMNIPGL